MGRATRWFKSLLGGEKKQKGKEKEEEEKSGSNSFSSANLRGRKEQKRWSFGKSSRYVGGGQFPASFDPSVPAAEAAWMRSYYGESEKEQSKHAIAVAAATAAAADAAVAAAQAAVEVVRLTSQARGAMFGGGREKWAALKIQKVFRGYLAKKALRALKALVKLQAHVRGYLVRKQAAATLYSMQALIRAQASVRSQRARRNLNNERPIPPEIRQRKSIERSLELRGESARSFHSRQLSASMESAMNVFDESPKIVEIDTCRPKSRSRRMNTSMSECGDDPTYQNLSSTFPSQTPARLSIPECRSYHDLDWGLALDECRFSTAQSTPRFAYAAGSQTGMPATPAKSVCAETFFQRYSNFPNYMANTKSFRAKLRSHSAPKQRPEPAPKKKISLNELVESRASLSGVRMQKSCSRVQEAYSLKTAVLGKLERVGELGREQDADYSQRRW